MCRRAFSRSNTLVHAISFAHTADEIVRGLSFGMGCLFALVYIRAHDTTPFIRLLCVDPRASMQAYP